MICDRLSMSHVFIFSNDIQSKSTGCVSTKFHSKCNFLLKLFCTISQDGLRALKGLKPRIFFFFFFFIGTEKQETLKLYINHQGVRSTKYVENILGWPLTFVQEGHIELSRHAYRKCWKISFQLLIKPDLSYLANIRY